MGVGRKGDENLRKRISSSFVSDFVWIISKWVHMDINVFVTLGKKRCINTGLHTVVIQVKYGTC